MKRKQFPIKLAFAMTINKSQGQTLSRVGVHLQTSCFSHGQLYVALSRVGDPDQLKISLAHDRGAITRTTNKVYSQVTRTISHRV